MNPHSDPSEELLTSLAARKDDGPLVALNLHRRASVVQATLPFFRAGTEPRLDTAYGR